MLGQIAKKIFGSRNDRIVRNLHPIVVRVNDLESRYEKLTDDQLRGLTVEFRERIGKGEPLDALLPEAFAVVREASKRTLGLRHFDTQLVGGAVLHQGKIAEMKTGEGKTLVATLPVYLNALSGKGVHVVTVNDYLARRDTEWMGRIYNFLDLSVGCVFSGMDEDEKRRAYRSDITYGQNNEFGFDYLRDNMKYTSDEMLQRGHHFAIVDEVDSILIDEARTPLIISGPAEDSTELYAKINKIIPFFEKDRHYEIELRNKQPSLTEEGIAKAEELLGVENLYDPQHIEIVHHVNQGLRAHTTMERDVDYVVRNGEIIIVDEFTGRLMPGRRWSNGLHQAVEAKEGVRIRRENQTLASITFQNLFRMYSKLAGMTGTADTEAAEFLEIYKLETVVIPTNRPLIRDDQSDLVFRTRTEKYDAVVEDIVSIHETGQPILVGTISIEQSEQLSAILSKKGVPHSVLNAKHHEREAEIVAQAGRLGAVTISTNMAGRGTDIVLGGNAEFMAAAEVGTKDPTNEEFKSALAKYREQCSAEREKVLEAGGLFIMGTERHEARRIDNQLRGRAGRQGDPGASRFYVSLEDELMRRFGGERLQNIMNKLGWEEGLALDGRLISRTVENAQQKVERMHFDSRKHVTEYDDVMNKQRQVVYNLRAKILFHEGVRTEIHEIINDLAEDAVLTVCDEKTKPINWNLDALKKRFEFLFREPAKIHHDMRLDRQELFDALREQARKLYDDRAADLSSRLAQLEHLTLSDGTPIALSVGRGDQQSMDFSTVEHDTFLETLDHFWNQHLQEMDHLREGVGLRGYGQLNPLYEYQREGFLQFQQMLDNVRETVVRKLMYYEVPDPRELVEHIEAERRRRAELEERLRMVHESTIDPEDDESDTAPLERGTQDPSGKRDPEAERAKRKALRQARRKGK